MKLSEFKKILTQHSEKHIRFVLPTGGKIPAHAHVTEVARDEINASLIVAAPSAPTSSAGCKPGLRTIPTIG